MFVIYADTAQESRAEIVRVIRAEAKDRQNSLEMYASKSGREREVARIVQLENVAAMIEQLVIQPKHANE